MASCAASDSTLLITIEAYAMLFIVQWLLLRLSRFFFIALGHPQRSTLFPYTTLFRSRVWYALKREEDEGLLRQGAWYPVVTSGVTRAVLEVSGQRVTVPQEALEVRDKRPDRFTVVYRTREDPNPARGTRADVGRRYGVCPM